MNSQSTGILAPWSPLCIVFVFVLQIFINPPPHPISNTLESRLLKDLGLWLFALLAPDMYAQFSVHAMFLFNQMNEATLCY